MIPTPDKETRHRMEVVRTVAAVLAAVASISTLIVVLVTRF